MRLPRPLVRFLTLGSLFFLLIVTLGPRGSYPAAYRAGASALFSSCGGDRVARFDAFEDPRGVNDTRMSVGARGRGYPSSIGLNSLRQGYVPAALLIALVLATPVVWRRRLIALSLGLTLVHAFIALRLAVTLAWGFSVVHVDGQRLLDLSRFSSVAVRRADQLLSGDLYTTYLVPIVIWALITLSPRDLGRLWPSAPPIDPVGPTPE